MQIQLKAMKPNKKKRRKFRGSERGGIINGNGVLWRENNLKETRTIQKNNKTLRNQMYCSVIIKVGVQKQKPLLSATFKEMNIKLN